MVRTLASGGVSLFFPGVGHMLINFQFLRGLLIMVAYLLSAQMLLLIVINGGIVEFLIAIMLLIGFHVGVAALAMYDLRRKKNN